MFAFTTQRTWSMTLLLERDKFSKQLLNPFLFLSFTKDSDVACQQSLGATNRFYHNQTTRSNHGDNTNNVLRIETRVPCQYICKSGSLNKSLPRAL
ncbi:hypothetical protein PS15p_208182 [Mucor circinelloides]